MKEINAESWHWKLVRKAHPKWEGRYIYFFRYFRAVAFCILVRAFDKVVNLFSSHLLMRSFKNAVLIFILVVLPIFTWFQMGIMDIFRPQPLSFIFKVGLIGFLEVSVTLGMFILMGLLWIWAILSDSMREALQIISLKINNFDYARPSIYMRILIWVIETYELFKTYLRIKKEKVFPVLKLPSR